MTRKKQENLWLRDEVITALAQKDNAGPEWVATGVSIDSRTLQSGDLFIALRGDPNDGHDYISQAITKGAGAVIAEQAVNGGECPVLVVPDTLAALTALGRYRRGQTQAKIVALTGSVGKTTTKEFLQQLCRQFGPTAYSQSSYNNCWGVPLSLARMSRDDAFGIFEIGTNHPGEIAPLAQLTNPHVALITLIGEAHMGLLGSLEAIAEEKGEILGGLVPQGGVILNRDDAFFDFLSVRAHKAKVTEVVSFGQNAKADVRLLALDPDPILGQMAMTFQARKVTYQCRLPFLGEHRAMNALGAFAAAVSLGLDPEKVCKGLSNLSLITGRGQIHTLQFGSGTFTLIDDAYNANPTSMRAAFAVCAMIKPLLRGRRLAVLGEMGELGDYSVESHAALAPLAQTSGIDLAFACGSLMTHFHEKLPVSCQGGHMATIEELIPLVEDQIKPGDVLLVKGSKSSRVNLLVEALLAHYPKSST
jgi:UDP-N-acetylmuramoyl-tripeptide--D-alanyl-D-alanine ligase